MKRKVVPVGRRVDVSFEGASGREWGRTGHFIDHPPFAFVLAWPVMLAEASLLVALSVHHGSGAQACLGAAPLARRVERRLKRRVFVEPERAQLRFVVRFERRGDETEAHIEVSGKDGQKRGSRSLVTSGHCSALDDSLALSVALLVDQPPEPEPEPEPPPPADASTAPPPPPAPPRRKREPTPITIPPEVDAPREPWHFRIGASGSAVWGALPGIVPGFALHARLEPRRFVPIVLGGELLARASAERDAASGARFRLLRVSLASCPPLLEATSHAVSLCVGQKLGWLDVEGYGFEQAARERRLTYALTLGGEGRLRVAGPVSLRGYVGGEVPVVRDRFASSGRNAVQLFEASPAALAAEIGVEVGLW